MFWESRNDFGWFKKQYLKQTQGQARQPAPPPHAHIAKVLKNFLSWEFCPLIILCVFLGILP